MFDHILIVCNLDDEKLDGFVVGDMAHEDRVLKNHRVWMWSAPEPPNEMCKVPTNFLNYSQLLKLEELILNAVLSSKDFRKPAWRHSYTAHGFELKIETMEALQLYSELLSQAALF